MSKEKIIALEGHAEDREAAIRLCGRALFEAGLVGESFAEVCVNREKERPTGICSAIPAAIPHCQSETITQSGVCYLRLDAPVEFRRMDDDYENIMTRSVFNLAIQSAGGHLDFLQKMMGVLGDENLMKELESMDIEQVPAALEKRLRAAEAEQA